MICFRILDAIAQSEKLATEESKEESNGPLNLVQRNEKDATILRW